MAAQKTLTDGVLALFADTHGYALVLGLSVPRFLFAIGGGQGDASRRWIGLKVRT